MTITFLKNIFEKLKTFDSNFEFLYDSQKLKSLDDNELKECCVKFHSTFSHDNSSDIDVDDIFSQLRVLQYTLPTKIMSVIDILKFVEDIDCYPNVSIAYRVLVTMLVTMASPEISFSKLKFIKTYK
ncbi:zinc finger MYM-type protein [Trifolium repens]|nr:zinc finger MYM-type protein [Trifolium repens]